LEPSAISRSGVSSPMFQTLRLPIIEGHHFFQQEQANRVNTEILSVLNKFTENWISTWSASELVIDLTVPLFRNWKEKLLE
jgi:hypothetical protein